MGRHQAAGTAPSDSSIGAFGIPATTCTAPARRVGTVEREGVLKRFRDVPPGETVVVAAPAGYGKTTAVALWSDIDPRPFAWVQLDRLDDDAVHLLQHVAAALHGIEPLDDALVRLVTGPGKHVDTTMLPALGRHVATRQPFVLVLDDLHFLTSPASRRVVEGLLAYLTPPSSAVLIGRSIPNLHLARLRVSHGLTDLGTEDLAMSVDEAAQVLEESAVVFDGSEVERLVTQTEGWPCGLHLAALALRSQPGVGRTFSDRDELVADYLFEEVLDGLAPDAVDFLARSAVLERMSAPLLDELLERDDSARQLAAIERSGNLFLVPLDRERTWYRYHHLFAELLRQHLAAVDPVGKRAVHARASRLLERDGDLDAAIVHAIEADDHTRAAEITLRDAARLAMSGRTARLGTRLAVLGDPADTEDPLVALAWAWYAVGTGDVGLVRLASARADRHAEVGPLPDGSPDVGTAVALLQALLAVDGVPSVLRDAGRVRAAGGPDRNPWWAFATAVGASASTMLGQHDAARAAIAEARPHLDALPAVAAAAEAFVALLDLQQGRLAAAERAIDRADALLRRHNLGDAAFATNAYSIAALVLARRHRPDASLAAAATARRLLAKLGGGTPRTRLLGYLNLAEAALTRGDLAEARAMAAEADDARRVDGSATWCNAQLDDLAERLAAHPVGAGQLADPLTPAELRVLAYLPTHLSLQEIAAQLFISRNTAKTHAVAIYRKLGVSSRSDAVAAARHVGLVEV